jgi:hypothetical protein
MATIWRSSNAGKVRRKERRPVPLPRSQTEHFRTGRLLKRTAPTLRSHPLRGNSCNSRRGFGSYPPSAILHPLWLRLRRAASRQFYLRYLLFQNPCLPVSSLWFEKKFEEIRGNSCHSCHAFESSRLRVFVVQFVIPFRSHLKKMSQNPSSRTSICENPSSRTNAFPAAAPYSPRDGSTTGFNRSAGRARQPAVGRARHSVRAAPATIGPWFFPNAACQSGCPKCVPPGSLIGTPHFGFATVPSRLVTPNPTKSTNFAPVHLGLPTGFLPAPLYSAGL